MCNNSCNKFLLYLCGRCRVNEQQHFAEGDASEVLHGACSKVGQCKEVAFVAGVGDAVVVLEPLKCEGTNLESELGEMALTRHVNQAKWNVTHHDGVCCF